MTIKIIRNKINKGELNRIAQEGFGEVVKVVVDIVREVLAVGGELHADEEIVLVKDSSESKNLWGANIYLNKPREERIEFSALINIRPSQNNRSMEIQDSKIKEKVEEIINRLIE